MEDYKVRYEDLCGNHVTEFMTKKKALDIYNSKLKEKSLVTIWCDVEYWDINKPNDDAEIIKRFTRRTDLIFGKLVVLPEMTGERIE